MAKAARPTQASQEQEESQEITQETTQEVQETTQESQPTIPANVLRQVEKPSDVCTWRIVTGSHFQDGKEYEAGTDHDTFQMSESAMKERVDPAGQKFVKVG